MASHCPRLLRPAGPLVTARPCLDYSPEDLAFRATLPCHGSPPTRRQHPAAGSGRPFPQLRASPGSPSAADRYDKLVEKNLEPNAAEGVEKSRGFVTRQEFLAVERELEEVRTELQRLRWKVQRIGEAVQPLAEESKRYNGHTLRELKAMVQAEEDPYRAAHKILLALFSDARLPAPPPSASPEQQPCNAKALPKPSVDPEELYTVYCDILQSIFPGLGSHTLKERTQSV